MPCLGHRGRQMFGVWGSIFQVRRFSDGRLPWEKWTSSQDFRFFGFGGSQVALSSLSVVLFQFSQWIFSQVLQFFQSCLRILNSQVCCLLVFFSSHKKHFSNSSVLRFGFRLSSVFGFHGSLLWTLQTNIVPSFVCSTFEDLQAG